MEHFQGPGDKELRLYPEGCREPWKCLNRRQHFKSRQQEVDIAIGLEVGRPMTRLSEGKVM